VIKWLLLLLLLLLLLHFNLRPKSVESITKDAHQIGNVSEAAV